AIGDYIAYTNEEMKKPTAETSKFTFAGSVYFNRMKDLGFYTIDKKEVEKRVKNSGLEGIFNKKIIK
ncbi:MAG: FAD-dependent oxidoreductase, partial [Paraclostridium sp.]